MFFLGKLFARDCCISMIGWTHCVAFPLLLVLSYPIIIPITLVDQHYMTNPGSC